MASNRIVLIAGDSIPNEMKTSGRPKERWEDSHRMVKQTLAYYKEEE